MNKNFTKILFSLISLLSVIGVFAQDVANDFTNINNTFLNTKKISMNVNYSVINLENNKSIYSQDGIIKKFENRFYRKDGDLTTITTDTYELIADSKSQVILLQPSSSLSSTYSAVSSEAISDALKICSEMKRTKISDNIIEYEMFYDSNNYNKIVIRINTRINFIISMTFYNKPYYDAILGKEMTTSTVVTFTDINLNPDFNINDFSYKLYLDKQLDEYKLLSKYQEYEFLNMLKTK